jgi:hypothetical protein
MPSLRARLINKFILPLRGLRKLMSSEECMARRYASFRPEAALPPRHLGRSYRIQRHTAGSMTTFEMTPLRDGSGLHLLYLHGGGYVNELLHSSATPPVVASPWHWLNYCGTSAQLCHAESSFSPPGSTSR